MCCLSQILGAYLKWLHYVLVTLHTNKLFGIFFLMVSDLSITCSMNCPHIINCHCVVKEMN